MIGITSTSKYVKSAVCLAIKMTSSTQRNWYIDNIKEKMLSSYTILETKKAMKLHSKLLIKDLSASKNGEKPLWMK